jgi:glucose-6-phosphate 1-epimerase
LKELLLKPQKISVMMNTDELDDKFGIEAELCFIETDGDLIAISIYNKFADAEICLYGGHVTRYMPHGSFDSIWMSQASLFEEGKPIRGGIPVCFPWFGPHPTDPSLPLHGFARLMYWDVLETKSIETGETFVKLQLCSDDETKKYWPYDFRAILSIMVGRTLDVSLSIENTGDKNFEYSAALHTYIAVSGIENIRISGLSGNSYYNGLGSELLVQEEELLAIEKEENRRYINFSGDCLVIDPVFNQVLRIAKKGSNVTVVWNPGEETSANIEDMTSDGFQEFVCVEAVNAYNDCISLAPGEIHSTETTIGLDQKIGVMNLGQRDGGFTVL